MKIETYPEADLASALAARVADDLRAAIASRGRASLAVPGGSTPAPFLAALAQESLDWNRVAATLTDERCVGLDSPRSNGRLVAEHLLSGKARDAAFVPLHVEGQALAAVEQALAATVLPLDVCVLGMGADMHTASLFPGTDGLAALLDRETAPDVAAVSPPGADEARITLTARSLDAAKTYLLIRGAAKRAALEQAMRTGRRSEAPIRAILETARKATVFYAD